VFTWLIMLQGICFRLFTVIIPTFPSVCGVHAVDYVFGAGVSLMEYRGLGTCVFCSVIRSVPCFNCWIKNVSHQFINLPLGHCFNSCNVSVACPYFDYGLIYVVQRLIVIYYYVCTLCAPCSVFLFCFWQNIGAAVRRGRELRHTETVCGVRELVWKTAMGRTCRCIWDIDINP
jgi:hypothetical protein